MVAGGEVVADQVLELVLLRLIVTFRDTREPWSDTNLGYEDSTTNLVGLGPHELSVVTDNKVLAGTSQSVKRIVFIITYLGSQASTTVALKS